MNLSKKRLLFIVPSVGRKRDGNYVNSWKMEPLQIAVLSALTPSEDFEKQFVDDRLESIPYESNIDAVFITVETYTARRAYQIAEKYRGLGIPVIMGGFHATLIPAEVSKHADTVVTGEAEGCWVELLEDLKDGNLKPRYSGQSGGMEAGFLPDRAIYAEKKYMNLSDVGNFERMSL